jgi:cytochrome c551/c552
MKRLSSLILAMLLPLALGLAACGGSSDDAGAADPAAAADGLSAEQVEKGIGPVQNMNLDAIDATLAAEGEALFTTKCSACHKMDQRYVGPALGDVTERRTPEFVMNMILNPAEMVQKHPEAKAMLAQFMTPMPNQNLTQDEARAVLEYLRQAAAATQ